MAVTCENLVLSRGDFRLSAHIAIPQGASLALIGSSGSGKSLFLGGLAGFDQARTGRIRLAGQDVTNTRPQHRPVSVMFQDHNLFPHLSAAQNVGLGLNPGLRLSAADDAVVARALHDVSLDGMGARYPADLSGGQQSRVALARALVRDRPVLLLDEPFAALGPKLRREMLALVDDVREAKATTTIYVTHDPKEAETADLAAFVGEGRITPPTTIEAFFADPPDGLRDYL